MVSYIVYSLYRVALFCVGTFLTVSSLINVLYSYISMPNIDNVYDYIIGKSQFNLILSGVMGWFTDCCNLYQNLTDCLVGGGTAGSVIAGRLARDQGMSVLLLEAGPAPPSWELMGLMNVPLLGPVWQRSEIDWTYTTSPQDEACDGLIDKVGWFYFNSFLPISPKASTTCKCWIEV